MLKSVTENNFMDTKGHQKVHSKNFTVKAQRQLSRYPVTSGDPLCRNRQSKIRIFFYKQRKKDMMPLFFTRTNMAIYDIASK